MPTYGYECLKCGHNFELFQSMSAAPRKRCPRCRGKVKRLIGGGLGVIFKGSGFYQTDYKKRASTKNETPDCGSCRECPKGGKKDNK